MGKIIIHPVKASHAGDLHRLFRRAVAEDFTYFPDHYRRQVLRENNYARLLLASLKPRRLILGAHLDNKLIGYLIGGLNVDRTGKIYWLYVSPEGRGQRIGNRLIERVIALMKRQQIDRVSLVTHNYDQYYAKLGFSLDKIETLYGVEMKVMSYTWAKI